MPLVPFQSGSVLRRANSTVRSLLAAQARDSGLSSDPSVVSLAEITHTRLHVVPAYRRLPSYASALCRISYHANLPKHYPLDGNFILGVALERAELVPASFGDGESPSRMFQVSPRTISWLIVSQSLMERDRPGLREVVGLCSHCWSCGPCCQLSIAARFEVCDSGFAPFQFSCPHVYEAA